MNRQTSNAMARNIDVVIQPADQAVPLVPVDSKGNPLTVVEAGYRGVLPYDGMPPQLVVSNGKGKAEYSHGTHDSYIVKHYQDQRKINKLEGRVQALNFELALLKAQPPVMYREAWLVQAAAAVVGWFDDAWAWISKQ